MEDKMYYQPLPSNYVTLAQLQERWLKQKQNEKEKEKEEEEETKPKQEHQLLQREQRPKLHQHNLRQHQRRHPKTQQQAWRVIQTHGTGFGSATGNRHTKTFGPENRNLSGSNRIAVDDSCEKRESLGPKADDGDENAGHDGKGKELKKPKKRRVNQKPRADKEEEKLAEEAAQLTMEGTKELENSDVRRVEDKMEIKSDLNDKSNNLTMVVEEKDENAGHDGKGKESKKPKKKRVNQKPRADKEEKKLAEDPAQSTMEGTKEVENSDVRRVEDKMEIKSESNDKSNNLTMVVEEKLGAVSLNSKSEKQNGRLRRPYSSFRGSQRNHGGRFRFQEVQRPRGDKKIWVRKNEDSHGNIACGT